METVFLLTMSYPTFLWITRCKILFIVDDKLVKPLLTFTHRPEGGGKKP
ncbi:hypothetical protein [Erwinia sp. V71]